MRSLLHVTYNSCVHLSHGCDMHMACTKNRMVLVYEWQQPYILIRDGRWRMYEQLNRYWSLLFMCYSYCFPGHQLNLWIINSPSWWSSHQFGMLFLYNVRVCLAWFCYCSNTAVCIISPLGSIRIKPPLLYQSYLPSYLEKNIVMSQLSPYVCPFCFVPV